MKKLLLAIGCMCCLNPIFADEGMWLLTMLDKLEIQQNGCKLTPEQIYSINNSSLKDAVLGLSESDSPSNFFCTAELVSSKGLALTNYHCGFDMIQKHTSLTNNYIDNGFWAKNSDEELENEGITATRVVAMYDVTERIFAEMKHQGDTVASDSDSASLAGKALGKAITLIEKSVTDTCTYGALVKSFFNDNQYFLFVYETYKDVRLVGAPPRTIGKFGDETDNWIWPRHTGDFCVLRIYVDESGMPAEYSSKNKPLVPKQSLAISLKGYNENDYAMIMGFPGSTDRYKSSAEIKYSQSMNNSTVKLIGDIVLANYKKYMNEDSLVRIKYASKYDNLSNFWKYSIGQSKGITNLNVVDKKAEQEKALREWILADTARIAKYGGVIDTLAHFYENNAFSYAYYTMLNVGLLDQVQTFMFAYDCLDIVDALNSQDPVFLREVQVRLRDKAKEFYKNYSAEVDQAQFVGLTYATWYYLNYPIYTDKTFPLVKKYKKDVSKYATNVFQKSVFTDEARFYAFLDEPDLNVLAKDPMFNLLRYTLMEYFSARDYVENPAVDSLNTLYVDAIMKMHPDSLMYPDANSTLRLTYGSVQSYEPKDGVSYHYYTTLKGVMEKMDSTNSEFNVPAKLIELYDKKDYGRYSDKNGELPLCFITNNDITGGNSGSPVMNANGELIGIAFDGNWEAMSGDIIFEPSVQRTISVDVRYVLFVIDKFAGAGYLLDEMNIVQ